MPGEDTSESHSGDADIVSAVSFATAQLFGETDWTRGIDRVLQRLGEALDVSRVYVFANRRDVDGTLLVNQRFEWAAPGIEPQIDNPAMQDMGWEESGLARWKQELGAGREIASLVPNLPAIEQPLLTEQDIRSILLVPINVRDQWWGLMGLDDCARDREWTPAIRAALRAAAQALGGAIDRADTEAALHRHRRLVRERTAVDELTGLPTRQTFVARVAETLNQHRAAAVIRIDLQAFRSVNQSLGFGAGDVLLADASQRLRQAASPSATLARVGGDEFALLLDGPASVAEARRVAANLHAAFDTGFDVAGVAVRVALRIGLARDESHRLDAAELFARADTAADQARSAGPGHVQVYDSRQPARDGHDLHLHQALHDAVSTAALHAVFQPIVTLADGRVRSAEALCRWTHPERGTISPTVFIPLAERTGIIHALGAQMLDSAAAELEQWYAQAPGDEVSISVNVAPRQLSHREFARSLEARLERASFPPRALRLEITESEALRELQMLARLHAMGVSIAIDDFGTGFASLSMIKALRASVIKLDRSFVANIVHDRFDRAVIHGAVTLAQDLGVTVIAEGVETQTQRDALADMGCHCAQGFLYSPGLPSSDFRDFRTRWHTPPG